MFGNVVHQPIITGPENALILDIIPPMELYLLLGIVNHLYKILKATWADADEWPAALHIQPSSYHTGQFKGNQCRKLLYNVNTLQQLNEEASVLNVFGIIDTFKKVNLVVKSYFVFVLKADYANKIDQFKALFLAITNGNITPKVHSVMYHVKNFINRKRSPLGLFCEQAV